MRTLTMCLRNLFRRRVRTFLCVLGIALATTLIVAIGATTSRYIYVIKEMHTYFSGKIVVVSKGAIVIEAFPIATGNLPQTMVEKLKQVNGTKDAVPMLFIYNFEGALEALPRNFTIGIPQGNWSALVGFTPLKSGGRWPSANESEAVIGSSLSDQFNLTVGDAIKLKDYDLKVTGVLNTSSALLSRSIIMPLDLVQEIYGYNKLVNLIVVEPRGEVNTAKLAERIETEIANVNALTEDERTDLARPLISNLETWALGIRTVLFILSMIFVTTVAMMNISERRRDFATLDAIGAPKSFIFKVVTIETGLMGFFGGLSGILLGSFVAIAVASVYTGIPISLFFPGIFDITPPILMLEILASTVAVSCIAGIIPSIAAARMKITEVLRAEY
ncbi:ABC transporter permease [Candidatus Bathyarchaeota archaeon]|nr:ABC transporter permease [Candidatus Bathyarchaeota archaeon]